jgi:(2Fe-2S) ferredoxin
MLRRLLFATTLFVSLAVAAGAPWDKPSEQRTGQGELQRLLKVKLAQRGLKLVRGNKSGCLDQCELGATVAVYPEGVFYGGVRLEVVHEIIESHVVNDQPVEHLRIPDEILNTTRKKTE